MIIKKFQGKTENEAIEAAKKELGNNVVVMNVRNVKKKGIFSFLRPQMVEVTVALEEETERYAPVKKEEKKENKAEKAVVDEKKESEVQPLVSAIAKEGVKAESGRNGTLYEASL